MTRLQQQAGSKAEANALQVKVTQRYAHGLQYQANYTWSRVLDEDSAINNVDGESGFLQDQHNLRGDYGPANFDQTHRVVLNGTYELPVGKGKRWSLGPANWVLGGWRAMDSCARQAQTAYPEFTAEANAKRDAKLKECLNANGLPPRQPLGQPQSR